ncbi:hypothetical protein PILCRDRAFT_93414 [Piloderma croceum F 1598]|uniref:Uncharacterized protein n=1 Tax=Piloderma croceum (strain F 1598) TaxID=765440 RepID=A0A0C3EIW7_PILCF|nr:hypothetical protein PILCRDRAFT_93414 [Piloderma croceum F 1598]
MSASINQVAISKSHSSSTPIADVEQFVKNIDSLIHSGRITITNLPRPPILSPAPRHKFDCGMQGDLSFYVSPFDKRDSGQLVCGVFNQGCMWGIDPIQGSSSSRTDAEGIERSVFVFLVGFWLAFDDMDVAQKMNKLTGDGTTTATVLTSVIHRSRVQYRLVKLIKGFPYLMIHICVSTINRLTDSHAPWMATQCYRQRFNISSLLAIYDWWPTRARLMAIAAIREGPSQLLNSLQTYCTEFLTRISHRIGRIRDPFGTVFETFEILSNSCLKRRLFYHSAMTKTAAQLESQKRWLSQPEVAEDQREKSRLRAARNRAKLKAERDAVSPAEHEATTCNGTSKRRRRKRKRRSSSLPPSILCDPPARESSADPASHQSISHKIRTLRLQYTNWTYNLGPENLWETRFNEMLDSATLREGTSLPESSMLGRDTAMSNMAY